MTQHQDDEQSPVERLCQVCGRQPVTVDGRGTDRTCAACVGQVRTHIKNLGIMSVALLGEALLHRVDSTAAALAGPVADPETWTYRRTAMLANRVDPKWLDDHVDLHHPLWVLATWERETRAHLHQTLSPGSAMPTLTEARDYLDTHLTRLAHDGGFAFDQLADDIKICHNQVERVLALEEHIDRGAPCPACERANLEKRWGATERFDQWVCPRCGQAWSETDYRLRVADDYLANAKALCAADIERVYDVPAGTTRRWANTPTPDTDRALVRKRGYDGARRQLYDIADVIAQRDARTAAAPEARVS